jgi:hypothetical protein
VRESENRQLRDAHKILREAGAHFALMELDRRCKS